jgi:hypothetical protein
VGVGVGVGVGATWKRKATELRECKSERKDGAHSKLGRSLRPPQWKPKKKHESADAGEWNRTRLGAPLRLDMLACSRDTSLQLPYTLPVPATG